MVEISVSIGSRVGMSSGLGDGNSARQRSGSRERLEVVSPVLLSTINILRKQMLQIVAISGSRLLEIEGMSSFTINLPKLVGKHLSRPTIKHDMMMREDVIIAMLGATNHSDVDRRDLVKRETLMTLLRQILSDFKLIRTLLLVSRNRGIQIRPIDIDPVESGVLADDLNRMSQATLPGKVSAQELMSRSNNLPSFTETSNVEDRIDDSP